MWVINTDTNAVLGGVPVPQGVFEWPIHGQMGVLTSQGAATNFNIGSGDTLFIWAQGAALSSGPEPWQAFLAGLLISWGGLGLIAFARRIASFLTARAVKEV